MFYFYYYDTNIQDVVKSLKQEVEYVNSTHNHVIIHHFGNKIVLQKRKIYHAFQRKFIGNISKDNDIICIKGKFHYPIISIVILIIFCVSLIMGNISAMSSDMIFREKIIAQFIFMIMYIFFIGMLATGKYCFKTEEKDVIMLLNRL